MGNNIRASGIDVIGKIPWGTHFCQFYQTKGDLMEIVVPYFKAGLENNESCIWITSQLFEVEEAKEALRKGIPDFDFYLEKGQIEIGSYFDFCIKDYISESDIFLKKWIKILNPEVTSDYAGLRVSGDTFWSEAARQNFVFYEEEVDRVISKYRMIALCTYSIDKCNIAGIAEIISNHLFILAKKEGRWEKIENLGRKKAEESLAELEKTRIKEIHHRIKNNLQVISSLLGLQAEKFSDAKVLEAFKESQNRVASMALIHEELYKGIKIQTLDFADYLRKLAVNLFSSYNLRNDNISLNIDLEQIYLYTDTAIPLGIIVNEMVSNSLKHAFSNRKKGEIGINLKKAENFAVNKESSCVENGCKEGNSFQYILRVADNGKGIPEEIDFRSTDSLGFQLINLLVGQIDGCVELRRDQGTEFTIRFSKI